MVNHRSCSNSNHHVGSSKDPEFAKALGRAKGEFSKASKEFSDAATMTANAPATTINAQAPAPATVQTLKSKDEILLETARNLGIDTDGKTESRYLKKCQQR